MKTIPNLLIVSGTGSKSGKTTMVCRLIGQFRDLKPVAIKISPHFHEKTGGLLERASDTGYSIHAETDPDSGKDTSRMLKAGASEVFLLEVWNADVAKVFNELTRQIPAGTPIICESTSLRNHFEPGLFILMTAATENSRPDLEHLKELPHIGFRLEELASMDSVPVRFEEGVWVSSDYPRDPSVVKSSQARI
jgi:hypothetical protein